MNKIILYLNDKIIWLGNKGFFYLLSANFLCQFLGFGTVLFVTKFITPTELGEIKIIQSYMAIFILIAGFGFNTSVLKYCSENRPIKEKKGILNFALRHSIIFIVLSFFLLIILVYLEVLTSSHKLSFWLIVYSMVLPFSTITGLGICYLQALKKIKQMSKAQSLMKLQSFVFIVISSWLFGFKGFIIATIFAYFLGLLPLLRQIDLSFIKEDPFKPHGFINLALYSVLTNGLSLLGQYTDIFILDHFTTERVQIGYYSLAAIFLTGAMQITGTVQSIITPYFSEHSRNARWFLQQLRKNQLRMIALSLVVAFGIYILVWILINFVYGETYSSTLNYLIILLVKYVIYSSYAVIGVALLGLGLTSYSFFAVAISTPVNLFSSYYLLKIYGVIGVAYAQVLSAIVTLMMVLILDRVALKKYFGNEVI